MGQDQIFRRKVLTGRNRHCAYQSRRKRHGSNLQYGREGKLQMGAGWLHLCASTMMYTVLKTRGNGESGKRGNGVNGARWVQIHRGKP